MKYPSIHAPFSSASIGTFHFSEKIFLTPIHVHYQRAPIMGFIDVHQVNCPIWGWNNSEVKKYLLVLNLIEEYLNNMLELYLIHLVLEHTLMLGLEELVVVYELVYPLVAS